MKGNAIFCKSLDAKYMTVLCVWIGLERVIGVRASIVSLYCCIFAYLYICLFVYLYICVFVFVYTLNIKYTYSVVCVDRVRKSDWREGRLLFQDRIF